MSSNKFGKNYDGYDKHQKENRIFYMGVVDSSDDASDSGRIQVRIKGFDDHINRTQDLPYSFPLVQKFFHVIPKVGESVWVFLPDANNPFRDRLYVGPIISQPQNLNKDPHVISSTAGLSGGFINPQTAPSTIPETQGVYPGKNDIALQGRNNTDITLKDNEIVIRAGKFIANDRINGIPKFNKENPAYIQIKHGIESEGKRKGIMTMVADQINIVSHEGSPRFNMADQKSTITDEEMIRILANAHPLAFGDLLLEYLQLFKDAFLNHVHSYNGMKPEDLSGQNKINKFLEYDISKIISKNIRIN